jgi:hypothetical protein
MACQSAALRQTIEISDIFYMEQSIWRRFRVDRPMHGQE